MYLPDKFAPSEAETKPDPFTLAALIAWLRTKNPNETYCWMNTGECLFSQYGKHLGLGDNERSAYFALVQAFNNRTSGGDLREPFPIALPQPHTFGAALARALSIAGKS